MHNIFVHNRKSKNMQKWMIKLFNKVMHVSIIDCRTKKNDRKNILNDFATKNEISIIINVHVLDEGINIPECDSVFITNPSHNIENIVQRMSRCNRKIDNKGLSYIYLWCKENKVKTIMDYINGNTNNELIEKYSTINFANCDKIEEKKNINEKSDPQTNDKFHIEHIFGKHNIKVVYDNKKEPWFCSKQIAKILEYQRPKKAIQERVEDNNKTQLKNLVDNHKKLGKNMQPNSIFVNAPGICSLINKSRQKVSEEYKKLLFENLGKFALLEKKT